MTHNFLVVVVLTATGTNADALRHIGFVRVVNLPGSIRDDR